MSYLCPDIMNIAFGNHIFRGIAFLSVFMSSVLSRATCKGDTVYVEADSVVLRELTVTAALHPVVMSGDTLIYDVSAFSLPAGSRLRELLNRLPGIEVMADGTIYAQGIDVSCLLLNGRDFFAGNRTIVLENLPADVLLNVKVYERVQKSEEDTGLRSNTERVMDLSTTPDNNRGWFADVTGAGGYDRRYSGNANASRFDEKYQHMFTLAMDNLPESFGLGESYYDKLDKSAQTGDPHHRNVSAIFGKKLTYWETSGSVSYANTKTKNGSENFTEHMLSSGHLFSRSSQESEDRTHSVVAMGHIERDDSVMTITIDPQFSWTKMMDEGVYMNAVSSRALMDVLEWDATSTSPYLLNRQMSNSESLSHVWDAGLSARLRRRLNSRGRSLTASASWMFSDMDVQSTTHSSTQYFKTDERSQQQRRSDRPDRDQTVRVRLAWIEPLGKYLKLKGEYDVSYRTERIKEAVYADNIYSEQRSRDATYRYLTQKTRMLLHWTPSDLLTWSVGAHYQPVRSKILYRKYGTTVSQSQFVQNVAPETNFYLRSSEGWNFAAQYTGYSRQPSMLNLLPIVDDTNPLDVRIGNPSLKPSFVHQATSTFFWFDQNSQTQLNLQVQGIWEHHAMTDVVDLDQAQGVRRTSVRNVNGCRQFSGSWVISSDMKSDSHWTLDIQGDLIHARRVGIQVKHNPLATTTATELSGLETPFVTNQSLLHQYVALQWHPGWVSVKPYAFCSYNRLRTENAFQAASDLWLWGAGVICRVETSNGWSAAVDASRQSRRGYTDAVDNNDEWLVDLEVAYAFLKGRSAEVRLQVCDLLRQRELTRTITTATERMESAYSHSVTNYILLSFTYRFSLMGR